MPHNQGRHSSGFGVGLANWDDSPLPQKPHQAVSILASPVFKGVLHPNQVHVAGH